MSEQSSASTMTAPKEVTLTRIFNAPREMVYQAWTDPEQVAKWWGPHWFSIPFCELDVRPGGAMMIHMQGPDGEIYPDIGEYVDVAEGKRLVFISRAFEDGEGGYHLEAQTTVTFEDQDDGKTRLTLRSVVLKATPEAQGALAGMEQGWSESLEKLAALLGEAVGGYAGKQQRYPWLEPYDRLVGTWEVSGGTSGTIRYEWLEGGFFLLQHVDLVQGDFHTKGLEVIGNERPFGATEPSKDVKSRFYDNYGNTFDYVYEIEGDTLTIWGGERGSPAYFKATFSEDGNTLSGDWVYPGGGGYSMTARRID